MKNKLFLLWLFLSFSFISCAQEIKMEGILNCVSVHSSFDKGQEAIKTSIQDDLQNLNLYEYSHTLKELYELINDGEITIDEWDRHIDTLLFEVKQGRKDTIEPFFAIEYTGIIPFQAEYFIASLDKNIELKEKYPQEYLGLIESTSRLVGKGYNWDEIDALLVVFPRNSTVGTENIWYFLQVLGCPIIELTIGKVGIEDTKMILSKLDLSATFKTPLFLQIRKYQNLKNMVNRCSFKDVEKIELDARLIDKSGRGKELYGMYKNEWPNLDQIKTF